MERRIRIDSLEELWRKFQTPPERSQALHLESPQYSVLEDQNFHQMIESSLRKLDELRGMPLWSFRINLACDKRERLISYHESSEAGIDGLYSPGPTEVLSLRKRAWDYLRTEFIPNLMEIEQLWKESTTESRLKLWEETFGPRGRCPIMFGPPLVRKNSTAEMELIPTPWFHRSRVHERFGLRGDIVLRPSS